MTAPMNEKVPGVERHLIVLGQMMADQGFWEFRPEEREALDAAIRALRQGGGEVEYEFEVWQGGAWQAGGTATDIASAEREAGHYAVMYGQDGPEVETRIYEKRQITPSPASEEPT